METKRIVPIWAWIIIGILAVSTIYLYISNLHSVGKETNIPPTTDTSDKLKENNEQLQQKKPIEKAVDLALSIDDFPSGWEIFTRGDKTKDDIGENERYFGWQEGYAIIYKKIGESNDIKITQEIDKYPIENVSFYFDGIKEVVKEEDKILTGGIKKYHSDMMGNKYYLASLGNINIGDDSIAYKHISEKEGVINYYIAFIKNEYNIYLWGKDYELMKELARKIETKF